MKLWKNSGYLLIATGIIHNAIGIIISWDTLKEIYYSGFFNSINGEMDRNAIFWFLFGGFAMMLLGHLMQKYTSENDSPLPISVGFYLLIITVVGCAMMPLSGFWLVVPQAFIIIYANKNKLIEF